MAEYEDNQHFTYTTERYYTDTGECVTMITQTYKGTGESRLAHVMVNDVDLAVAPTVGNARRLINLGIKEWAREIRIPLDRRRRMVDELRETLGRMTYGMHYGSAYRSASVNVLTTH